MLRPVAPDPEVYAWLWSYEGQEWSTFHLSRVRHAGGAFAEVKEDHECLEYCQPQRYSPHADSLIFRELQLYGPDGVPEEWKRPDRRC